MCANPPMMKLSKWLFGRIMSLAPLAAVSTVFIASGTLSGIALSVEPDQAVARQDEKDKAAPASAESKQSTSSKVQLSEEAKAVVRSMQARDRQVHAHEQAHLAASGGLATSGASYIYQKGPDGVNYAVGGEVSIDVSRGSTPEDTIARAVLIRGAALAPADPSGQDRAVAAQASQMEQQARAELLLQKLQERLAGAYHSTPNPGDEQQAQAPLTRINQYA